METKNQAISYAQSDPGLKRTVNEDCCLADDNHGYFLVADGMGGAAAGEIASSIFLEISKRLIISDRNRDEGEAVSLVKEIFLSANSQILQHVIDVPEHEGMGCTAELFLLHKTGFVLGHIGDSRCYRFRAGELKQITKDHSLVQEQVEQGLISSEEAKKHRLRNVILRAVGVEPELAVDIIKGSVFPGDQLLLCTDGLSDMVDDKQISEVLAWRKTLIAKGEMLVDLAKTGGGKDNISIVLITII